jgi:hypothetical protein
LPVGPSASAGQAEAPTPVRPAAPAAKREKPEKPDKPADGGGGGEVVRLDRFRKK